MNNVMTKFRVKLGLKRDGKQKGIINYHRNKDLGTSGDQREPLALFHSDLQLYAFMPVP